MHEQHRPNRQTLISILSSFDIPRPFKAVARQIAIRAYDHGMSRYSDAIGYGRAASNEAVYWEIAYRKAAAELVELEHYNEALQGRLHGALSQLDELRAEREAR